MLEFHSLQERQASADELVRRLEQFRDLLLRDGMASMDEYGDMLKWALPSRDGMCRYFHVYHPGYCSFSDAFYGTIHFHGGQIRGTILLGTMEHYTYEAEEDAAGDRFLQGKSYTLTKHTSVQRAGTSYQLPAMVAHWLAPQELSLTYFEEEDNQVMGDLVNPASSDTDEHVWEQADADALLPVLLQAIERRLADLQVTA